MDAISKKLPDFFKVFLPRYSSERMLVPIAFLAQLNKPIPKNVVLQRRSGSRWFVKAVGDDDKVYFQEGWQKFVRDNGIETGDFLVFSYDGDNKFDVTLLGHSFCEKEELLLNIGMAGDEDCGADFDGRNDGEGEEEEVELLEDEDEVEEEEIELLEDEDEEFDDDEEEEDIELLEDESEGEEDEDEEFDDDDEEEEDEDEDEGEEKEEFDVYKDHDDDNEEKEIDAYTEHDEEEEETDVHMDHDDDNDGEGEEEEEIDAYMDHNEEEEKEEMTKNYKRKTNAPRTGESNKSHKKRNNFVAEKYIQTSNPYFVPKLGSSGLKYLHIPLNILKDFEINLPPKIRFHDPLGRNWWKGEVLKWNDGRTKIKGWKSVCRWNNIKKGDHCICELLLRKNRMCDTIKVHIIKPSPVHRS